MAANNAAVVLLAVSDLKAEKARDLATKVGAQLYSTIHEELINRSEVNAVMVSTSKKPAFGGDSMRSRGGKARPGRKTDRDEDRGRQSHGKCGAGQQDNPACRVPLPHYETWIVTV